jgi:hypothetical protein
LRLAAAAFFIGFFLAAAFLAAGFFFAAGFLAAAFFAAGFFAAAFFAAGFFFAAAFGLGAAATGAGAGGGVIMEAMPGIAGCSATAVSSVMSRDSFRALELPCVLRGRGPRAAGDPCRRRIVQQKPLLCASIVEEVMSCRRRG